jgi:hypothetical protein
MKILAHFTPFSYDGDKLILSFERLEIRWHLLKAPEILKFYLDRPLSLILMFRKSTIIPILLLLAVVFVGFGDRFLPPPLSTASFRTRTSLNQWGSIAQTMLSGQNHEEKPARQGFAVVSS